MECQHCNGWPRSLQKMDSLAVPVLAEAVEVRVLEVLGARSAVAASVASLEVIFIIILEVIIIIRRVVNKQIYHQIKSVCLKSGLVPD